MPSDVLRESLEVLLAWYAEGRIVPHVGHVLPLDRVSEGLELIRTAPRTGKVVITP